MTTSNRLDQGRYSAYACKDSEDAQPARVQAPGRAPVSEGL